ncbi:hypothetical protein SLEP1_g23314 [Rubroshorea leprosula]|uniref:Uncharacterized protein n=1 Tax=Rubroshorea leprosula TaxID=152421 RepID=A0AAV5JLA7_9ROSI|nr:hypothetical protein SLEP1_g23314 [Rubroshorea leprosula]
MEKSPERGRDSYTNCLFDQVIKGSLKCLGQDSSNEQAEGCPLDEGLQV